ncbi:uncharacterized protein LOC105160195 [Sesamum indicum]|uniref:Uncharacterized protein LOC105160195 n=1 Tax=Sesamum indicum TaxID=4182 RepID=A0A6I9SYA8_SESIN|nr:uncharacterized protein LOC105160195 [Sesamum indicum]
MEDGKSAMAHQQHLMQQQLLLQQIQRQKDAISRFPSNIDAHLRPQHPLLHHRPLNPNSTTQQIIPNHIHPNPTSNPNTNPNPNPNSNPISSPTLANNNPQQQHQHKASLQMAYQDAWRVCHPDFKRPFSSLEDACERLLPYHVVADYEAEEDDKILDSATTGQILSRSQQWDHNIAAKVAEFTATFEKQVLAFNIISRKRGLGEFRTEEKLMMEQSLLQDEKRALLELRAEMDSQQKASRETHEANIQMAAMVHAEQARSESQAHAEMMARAPIRASALGSRGNNTVGPDMGEQEQDFQQDDMINGWGNNIQKDDKEPSEDFLNDDETENGDAALQSGWPGGGELDLNAR